TLQWEQTRRYFIENAQGSAGTMPKIDQGIILRTPIRLPPVAEQHRIVAKVEALFAEVNAARNRLAKVPAILKRFRQSVLAAACSGRLTEDWRMQRTGSETAAELCKFVGDERRKRFTDLRRDAAVSDVRCPPEFDNLAP